MNDPRVLRLARQLREEGYVDDEANAREAAADILAAVEEHRRPRLRLVQRDDDDPKDETA